MEDITLTSSWTVLGNEEDVFSGCINGNDKKISGLSIETDSPLAGLIGYGYGAKIYNLTIESPVIKGTNIVGTIFAIGYEVEVRNVTINNVNLSVIEGENDDLVVGGVVGGAIYGEFDNIHISGSVTSLSTENAYVGGFIGGLIGGTISKSSTSDTIASLTPPASITMLPGRKYC